MIPAPIPHDEAARLEALRGYDILDTAPEPAFDEIARLAALICDTPVAMVSLVDGDRQWFKSKVGTETEETARDISFCGHTILGDDIFTVPDARNDERFQDNPLVTGDSQVGFYAGVPLETPDGHAVGALCVIDHEARELTPEQEDALRALRRQVVCQLELRRLLSESRRLAFTDDLTGLGNRRKLVEDVSRSLDGDHTRPSTLALFDLDGFKDYNDTFGHAAGDALLQRLAHNLRDAVDGPGAAYRMGGDEFCVLAYESVPDVIAAAHVALTETGEGFEIDASGGAVTLPREADTPADALGIADRRMYENKGLRRGSPARQTRDVLVSIIHEREPDLREHMRTVRGLAKRVARRLELDDVQVDAVARAAELHDIGKVAVPDTILHKPGPLDEDEWHFMRKHTILGERILNSAPALNHVAAIVRASHERWDGAGYPDRLAAEEIPLESRIIFACDAFDAMTSERPYSPAISMTAALEELRDCAGTQFDPDVVVALCEELAPYARIAA